jgi:hypothetical protein
MLVVEQLLTASDQISQLRYGIVRMLSEQLLNFPLDVAAKPREVATAQSSAKNFQLPAEDVHGRDALPDQMPADREAGLEELAFQILEVDFGNTRSHPACFGYPERISCVGLIASNSQEFAELPLLVEVDVIP